MELEVLRDVAASLHSSPFYFIMADDTTHSSNREQVVICLRWVDNSLDAHEELIGLQQVDRTDVATITITTKDVLQRMNLRLTRYFTISFCICPGVYLLVFLTNHVERPGLSSVRRWNICVKLESFPYPSPHSLCLCLARERMIDNIFIATIVSFILFVGL